MKSILNPRFGSPGLRVAYFATASGLVLAVLSLPSNRSPSDWIRQWQQAFLTRTETSRPETSNVYVSVPSASHSRPSTGTPSCADWNGVPKQVGKLTFHKKTEDAPVWAIRYGQEFWYRPPSEKSNQIFSSSSTSTRLSSQFDLGGIIDRVSHAITPGDAFFESQVKAKSYTANFGGHGLLFSPHGPVEANATNPLVDSNRTTALLSRNGFADSNPHEALSQTIFPQSPSPRPSDGWANSLPRANPETRILIRTLSIRSDTDVLYSAGDKPMEWSLLGNTAQALLNAKRGLVEHYEARERGVSVTWVFSHRLPTTEPLVIEAQVSGLNYSGETENGLHFFDASGIARVRIGKVRAVDSAGRSWEIVSRVVADRLRLSVPPVVLKQAVYPIAVDPIISPEFGMDKPVLVPKAGIEVSPSVASNGNTYLVVWEERAAASTYGDVIRGTRFSPEGKLLDPVGFLVGHGASPSVASDGSDFLVAWWSGKQDPAGQFDYDIMGMRVRADGVLIDSEAFPISTAPQFQEFPSVSFDGSNYLVAWFDERIVQGPKAFFYCARVSRQGVVLDPQGIPIEGTIAPGVVRPAVASAQGNSLVVWENPHSGNRIRHADIVGALVSSSGQVSRPIEISVSTGTIAQAVSPTVASDGSNYFVAWLGNGVAGVRIRPDGTVDSSKIKISGRSWFKMALQLASNGKDYLAAWNDASGLFATRFAATGQVLDAEGLMIRADPYYLQPPWAIASSGDDYLVVWQDNRTANATGSDIYAARVSARGEVMDKDGIPLSVADNYQTSPALASNGEVYFAVWQDTRNYLTSGVDIYGVRISPSGEVLDPSGIAVNTNSCNQYSPVLTASRKNFLVVWMDVCNGFIPSRVGARVTSSGQVLDRIPIRLEPRFWHIPPSSRVVAASNGEAYLLVWEDWRNLTLGGSVTAPDLYATRISADGIVLDPDGFAITQDFGDQRNPAVASDGTNYLVFWEDSRDNQLHNVRLTPGGVVLNTNRIPMRQLGEPTSPLAVASNGENYLMVWAEALPGSGLNMDVIGLRFDRTGNFITKSPISAGAEDEIQPAVASDGRDYFVTWLVRDRKLTTISLRGTRVRSTGAVAETSALLLSGLNSVGRQSITAVGPREFLVMAQCLRNEAQRVIAQLITTFDPLVVTTNRAILSWPAQPAKSYRVQFKSDLNSTLWTDLPGDVMTRGPIATKADETIGSTAQRFYRVIESP